MQQKSRLEVYHVGKHLLVLSVWCDKLQKNRTLNFDNTIFAAGAETHNQKQEKRILANKMF
jgi:hypothetical protein|nr:MAG TPA: hypothetical protein [Caudoviricetes sp.]